MKVFFDENFSPHLAKGFAAFQEGRKEEGIEVRHVIEVFGRGAPDEQWIPGVAQMHGAIITKDFNIHRTRQLAGLCQQHKAGIFFFRPPKKKGYDYWNTIEWVLRTWKSLKDCAHNTEPPYEYEVTPRCTSPRRL